MKLIKVVGSTSQLCDILIQDSTSTTGAGKTGLVYNTSGLTAYYHRSNGSASASITLATMTLGTWATGGFKEVDATNMPGVYQLGIPDAVLASGATSAVIVLRGATGMVDCRIEIQLTSVNLDDAVRGGMTALPNANAEAAGGLYTRGTGAGQINQPANGQIDANAVKVGGTTQTGRDIGASVLLSAGTGTGQLDFTSGVIKANLAQILGTALTETAGQIAAGFKQFFNIASPTSTMNLVTAVTTVTTTTTATNLTNAPANGDFTATMKTSLNAATPASVTGAVGSVTGNVGGNVVGSVGSVTGAVGSVTGAVGSVTGAVGSVTAGVTVTTNNDKTGYALSAAGVQAIWDALTSALTTVGSVGKRIADNLDAAITSRLATAGYTTPPTVTQIRTEMDTNSTKLDATVSSRLASASYTAPPTAAANADAVWDEAIAGHLTGGSTGASLNGAGSAGDPWTATLPGAYGAGSAGYIVGTNVNATIASRSTLDGTGVQSALTSQGYTTTRAGYLDTLNGLVAAIWDKATSAIVTAGSIGKLVKDYLDAAVSSRMATFTYTAPLTSTQTAQAVLDAVAASYNTSGSIGEKINASGGGSDPAAIADAVWDEVIAGHATPGTTGSALSAAGNAGDPWSTVLPGAYTGNQAGAQLPAIKAKTDTLSGTSITITSPVVDASTVQIVRGDDYKNADGRALFAGTTFSNAPSLSGGTVTLKVQKGSTTFTKAGVVTGAATCYVELTTAETAALTTGKYSFDLEATLSNTDVVTIAQGKLEVLKDVR